ncbi:MAG: hypothetical protein E4H14_01155 [Candidatus Thorarchaeota archaeon]|nr:MAG: hypothetical protein E4H14_01155 [Candidatus Thorarchaeota archaeon]
MKLREVMNQPTLIVPIGPSGAGKSSLFKKLKAADSKLQSFSLDSLRHEWYDADNYAAAWKASTEDKEFANKANARFMDMIASGDSIFVDNTNLTPKRRRFYLDIARRNGYKAVAYVFNVDLETLIARQSTRTDKNVPELAVRQQFRSMVGPMANEFDEVIPVDKNK